MDEETLYRWVCEEYIAKDLSCYRIPTYLAKLPQKHKNKSRPLATSQTTHIHIPRTANLPTLSAHPNTKCMRKKPMRCSSARISSPFICESWAGVRPSSCSQARGLQSSFPAAILPVSSRSVPMIFGFRERVRGVAQLRQVVWGVLA